MSRSSGRDDETDTGAPLPNFNVANIQLTTVAPAIGVTGLYNKPDYLEYDTGGRGITTTMFANTGVAYLMGTSGGGLYGAIKGWRAAPSSRSRVIVNSVLNHCGRHGSRVGNMLGVFSVMYSLYEGISDRLEFEEKLGIRRISPAAASMTSPAFGASMAAMTYYSRGSPRIIAMAGTLGFGAVAATYTVYSMLGIPYGSQGFLWF